MFSMGFTTHSDGVNHHHPHNNPQCKQEHHHHYPQFRLQCGIKNKAAMALQRKSNVQLIAALFFIPYSTVVLFEENA